MKTIKEYNPGFRIYVGSKTSIKLWGHNDDDNYALKDFSCNRYFTLPAFPQKEYSKWMISRLEEEIQHDKKVEDLLSLIEDSMEEIISDISNEYKSISEQEGDTLDELLSQIDYDVTPTKHLKITVEWI